MTPLYDIYMQRCRVAAKYLFRYRSALKISLANNLYYDLYVEDSSNGFAFGVKVVSPDFEDSEEFKQEYLPLLKKIDQHDLSSILPIALLSLDETTETGKCGVILSIGLSKIRIYYPPIMREVNADNFAIIMNDILASDYAIRSLYDNTYGVLKTISVKLPEYRHRLRDANVFGQIIYKRNFAQNYKMNTPEVIDDKEQWHRFMYGTPQSEYPHDELDNVILGALTEKFEDVSVDNSLFLFNSELRDLRQNYSNKLRKKLIIQVGPKIDSDAMALLGNVIVCPRIPLTIFIENPWFQDYFCDELILKSIDVKNWPSVYESITRLKQTLTDLSKIID